MKRILLFAVTVLSAAMFFYYISGTAGKVTHGFACYYTSSRILLNEDDYSKSYDTAYFNSKIREYGIENVRDLPVNIPTNSIMMLPLAGLKPADAKIVWTAVNVIFYLCSVLLLLSVFNVKLSSYSGFILIIISFLFLPVYHGFSLGQAYVFLLFLFSFSLYGLKNENNWFAAVPLALIIVLKGYGFFPLVALVLFKKWKTISIVIASAAVMILLTMPFIGYNAWSIFFNDVILKTGENSAASSAAYQTLNSFVRNISGLNSYPVFIILFISAAAAVYYLLKKQTGGIDSEFVMYSAFAGLNILFAPVAEDYHYALLLPVIFGTGKIIFEKYKENKAAFFIFLFSLILISAPLNYKSFNDASIPLILLAYPVLYGGIILIVLSGRMKNNYKTD